MFITRKLDRSTLLQWELQTPKYEDCTFSKIMHFLTCQCQSMANADFVLKGESKPRPRTITNPKAAVLHVRRERPSCISCSGSHSLLACPSFRQMSGDERRSNAIKRRLCLNCLRPGHIVHACQTKQRCFKCGHAHHTMLHDSTPYQTSPSNKAKHYRSPKKSENAKPVKSSLVLHSVRRVSPSHARIVLLSTVEVQVRGGDGRSHKVRALLDNGSELNLISEDLRRRLALKSKRMDVNLVGIGSNRTSITSGAVIRILPRIPNQGSSVDLDCAIMPEIANQLPSRNVSEIRSHLPLHLPLADPSFDIPGTVDMVIGSDAYHAMLRNGKRTILVPSKSRGDRGGRIAMMNTAFGWILGGSLEAPTVSSDSRNCHHTTGRDPLSCFGARRPVKTVTRPLDESRISAVRRFRLPKRNVPAPFNPHIFRPSQPSSHNSWPVPSWRTTSCATAGGSGRSARSEGATTPAHAAAAPGRQGHRRISSSSSSSKPSRIFRNNKIHRAEQRQAFQKILRLDKSAFLLYASTTKCSHASITTSIKPFQKILRLDKSAFLLYASTTKCSHASITTSIKRSRKFYASTKVHSFLRINKPPPSVRRFQKHYKRRYNPNNASRPTAASVDTQQQTSQHTAPDQPPLHYADLEDQPAGRASNTLPYPETFRT
ncbi:uncharacterized protein LOC143917210 [Arctopsyche grandis]|uniref:uncharacterized protein LOC143917210 n=1 Tax=Arctopsyche grandis TaxID=121162 RepID=UPI00406D946D